MIELSGYVLETLRKDEELVLYRGYKEDDASRILVTSPVPQRPLPESLKRLEHAYSLRDDLDPDWAAQPIAIVRHWDRTVLVMSDPGGVTLDQLLGGPLEIGVWLQLAISIATAIGHLHQRGLVHKDIKPAHILASVESGRCWLRGFGIASRLPRERQAPEPPEQIAGTLAYMAPEQTGRVNRSIDSRTDLYSFGVTLYEMLTGGLPFTAADSMEWVHCHIARKPMPPSERLANVPASISAIVMKLLAKTAEERYQTATGVESDLRRCLTEWETWGRIGEFTLGQHDTPNRLLIPEKLYGRAREIDALLTSFERVVADGKPELVLVSGYSGIGKSSVISELHKVLVQPRGLFASGKFEQYKRDIPYSTLAHAIQSLIRPVLGKSDTELQNWHDDFNEALGPNGKLIVDLIPELELIIGEQPPVPDLSSQDAQGRFQLTFRRFLGVFARKGHPLALFLDDLQWLDEATLDLLEDLLTRPDVQYLMLIGAYRDNEVDRFHPLTRKLEAIRKSGASVQEIVLAPLGLADLSQLIADALQSETEQVLPLAQLIHEKTAGNPFFAIQFLSALAQEELLRFDHGKGSWVWDLAGIQAKGYTDNVVDLMVDRLNRLPAEAQQALQEFACVGNSAAVETLTIVQGASEKKLHSDLWDPVRLELISRSDDLYRFAHDRIQEAAYSLIPERLRPEAHLRIGRLLAASTSAEKLEENIFEVVNQFDRGAALITSKTECERLAELNLIAGKRAKAATAYASALKYLAAGTALLEDDCWERRHDLVFPLELYRAECEFLTGQTNAAKERLAVLSSRAANLVELATVTCQRLDLHTAFDETYPALDIFVDYLGRLGVEWSTNPNPEEGRREYERIWSQLGKREIEELVDLPLMSDPTSLGTMDVLSKVFVPLHSTQPGLVSRTVCYAVNLSLERGNADGSCIAYLWLGKIAGPYFGDYLSGIRFGRLGHELTEKRGLKRFQAQAHLWLAQFIVPWTKHIRESRDLINKAYEQANKIGEITTASYTFDNINTNFLAVGDHLAETQSRAEDGLEFLQRNRGGSGTDIISAQLGLIRNLRGLTREFGSFDDGQLSEDDLDNYFAAKPTRSMPACWYWIRKLQARFFAGDCHSAVNAANRAEPLLWTSASMFESAEYHFYGALAHAACCNRVVPEQLRQHYEALVAHHDQLQIWAKLCPENFENRAALVGAEIARIDGRELDAERLYEKAIRSANANGFVHNEALASELAGQFYALRDFETIAHAYLRKARYCYLQWGAAGKVRQIDDLYPELIADQVVPNPTGTIGASVEHLDLATIVKVSQAVSGEIVFEKLIDTLMRTAIQHAGAERGLLIAPRATEQWVEAEAVTTGGGIVVNLREASLAEVPLPETIVHYVLRTQESVILDDASAESPFSADPYIRQREARSVLCLPLINRSKLIGVLYLENNLTSRVFTPTRIAVLKLLASQAAISLENTRLYRDLEQREAKIRRLFDAKLMGIFLWNLDGGITDANEAFLDMVMYSREDLVSGRVRWTDLTPTESWARVEQAVKEIATTGIFQPYEKEYLRKDGGRVPVMIGGAVFEGSSREGVAFVLDLSKQKQVEEALRRSETHLAEVQAELAHLGRVAVLGELSASVAHEINQPLTAITSNANASLRWMFGTTPNLTEAGEAIRRILRDGKRAGEIVNRIRALAKKTPPQKDWFDLNGAIDEVIAMVKSAVQRNGVSLQTNLAGDLPLVMGDRIQLQQVVLNLVMNAIEEMSRASEGPRELWVSSEKITETCGASEVCAVPAEGTHALVSVRDSGPGLDPGLLNNLFDAFYTTKPQGLGLGLAISRSIVEAHQGRIWATQDGSRGAIFQFTLPI